MHCEEIVVLAAGLSQVLGRGIVVYRFHTVQAASEYVWDKPHGVAGQQGMIYWKIADALADPDLPPLLPQTLAAYRTNTEAVVIVSIRMGQQFYTRGNVFTVPPNEEPVTVQYTPSAVFASCNNSNCNNRAQSRCERCRDAKYCGRDCQVAHWPLHRPLCRQIAELNRLDEEAAA